MATYDYDIKLTNFFETLNSKLIASKKEQISNIHSLPDNFENPSKGVTI